MSRTSRILQVLIIGGTLVSFTSGAVPAKSKIARSSDSIKIQSEQHTCCMQDSSSQNDNDLSFSQISKENSEIKDQALNAEADSTCSDDVLVDGVTDDAVVKQSDLFQVKEILELQAQRAVLSNYTINLSGYGIFNATVVKTNETNFLIGSSNAAVTLSGKLREDPVNDGDISYTVGITTNTTSAIISDLFFNWELKGIKSDLDPFYTISLKAGQYLIPFGSENLAGEDKKPTIKGAQFIGSYFANPRDVGFNVDLGLFNTQDAFTGLLIPKLALTAGLFNGAGANITDPTRGKNILLKATVTPVTEFFSPLYGLKFGGTVAIKDFDYVDNKSKTGGSLYNVQLEYLKKPFLFTGEYTSGHLRDNLSATDGKTVIKNQYVVNGKINPDNAVATDSKSYVLTLFYTEDALPDFQPLIRYDFFDPNSSVVKDAQTVYTVGFNYYFYQTAPLFQRPYAIAKTDRVLKLQANYNFIKPEDSSKPATGEIILQLVYSF
ncbi:MAG: hypothetical protein WCJ01_09725 [Ignavibacteria bacterium]